jgi:hypothetical protein
MSVARRVFEALLGHPSLTRHPLRLDTLSWIAMMYQSKLAGGQNAGAGTIEVFEPDDGGSLVSLGIVAPGTTHQYTVWSRLKPNRLELFNSC